MPNLNRRFFLTSIAKIVGSASLLSACSHATQLPAKDIDAEFKEGVASGDPLSDRVIIWTRLTPTLKGENKATLTLSDVVWQIAKDKDFSSISSQGTTTARGAKDFCVKVDAAGLEPATQYFYRFVYADKTSPVGRTKTLPDSGSAKARFAVVSCSNYGHGYFHVYREIAKRDDLDFVLHLGDYIYEYREDYYTDPNLVATDRKIEPKHEILSVDDYRARYRLYRRDKQLQAVHAKLPMISVWDDHEFANDSWIGGAEGHQANEGDWTQRKKNALKVYREYMPIRDPDQGPDSFQIYRRFDIGDLASLIMLDTRLIGREEPLDYRKDMIVQTVSFDVSDPNQPKLIEGEHPPAADEQTVRIFGLPFDLRTQPPTPIKEWKQLNELDPNNLPEGLSYLPDAKRIKQELLENPDRSLLGQDQEDWLNEQLKQSKAAGHTWQIIGQQVLTGRICMPNIADIATPLNDGQRDLMHAVVDLGHRDLPLNMDAWDGYNVNKQRVLNSYKNNANNVISLAGDTHNAWAFELTPDNEDNSVAVEFATASVSSPGLETYIPTSDNEETAKRMVERNRELVYHDYQQRGWLEVILTEQKAESRYHYVSSVKTQDYKVVKGPVFNVEANTHMITSTS